MASVTGSVESGSIVHVDDSKIRGHVDEVVRTSVEATLNGLLDAEADELCNAQRYERSADRVDTRSGSYDRKLQTKAGEVKLKVPRLRSLPFETQIIERWRLDYNHHRPHSSLAYQTPAAFAASRLASVRPMASLQQASTNHDSLT